ncbi:hypothetical protein, partial [Enterocloster lavalensis]|uniref:hypothetical protein n=1 Tax=Enterocloster lavalensis TaxID=460384 RepID=UPI002FDA17D1
DVLLLFDLFYGDVLDMPVLEQLNKNSHDYQFCLKRLFILEIRVRHISTYPSMLSIPMIHCRQPQVDDE